MDDKDKTKKIETLDILFKSKIPGYFGFNIESKRFIMLKFDVDGHPNRSMLHNLEGSVLFASSNDKSEVLDVVARFCEKSDVWLYVPSKRRDSILLFKKGDTVESLMIEADLLREGDSRNG